MYPGLRPLKSKLSRLRHPDFVLLNQGYQYLEAEPEKRRFFCVTLNVDRHFLPSSLYLGRKTGPTIRHFVDKFPMFLIPPQPVVTFTYIQDSAPGFPSRQTCGTRKRRRRKELSPYR
jgi:hypothetical protein